MHRRLIEPAGPACYPAGYMVHLLGRLVPGAALVIVGATVTTIALRTLARWRSEREWQEAWEAYRTAQQ